jgi:hypothetical protein
MRVSLAFVIAVSATALWSSPASAQDLISVEPRVPSGFPARLRAKLVKQAPRRLEATGVPVRSGADIAVAAQAAADCADVACLQEHLGATGARAVVRLELTQDDAGFAAVLEVTSLRTGLSLAHEEAACEGCSAAAATEVALSLIDGVMIPERDPEPPPPPPVEVAPPPPEVPPEALRLTPREERHVSPVAWATMGVGALLIGASIPLLLIDGDPTCDGPRQTCPDLYDTKGGGFAALTVGGVLFIGGLVWALVGGGVFDPVEPSQ